MVRTVLGVAFIAVVGAGATAAWFMPTTARGAALADLIFEPSPHRTIACDDDVPISATGAKFQCRATGDDGSTAVYDVVLERDGTVRMGVAANTGDPWNR